jgi:hypothetical protein
VEVSIHTLNAHFVCCWERQCSETELAASHFFLRLAGDCFYSTPFRYRRVPTFGRGTIRRFSHNASSMTKLAARDFEDLLQVSALVITLVLY